MADHDITRMTSNVTNVAIAILCELQAAKEDNESVVEYERPAYFGRTHTRVADFKRLLVACTKLVVNES